MCKDLKNKNVTHIVMENLQNTFGRTKASYNDVNFNRISYLLNISDIKNNVKRIALKYGITTSFIDPSYTSQMCPVCGCIEDENRPNQETFECIECGYKDNADFNAAKNIRNRVLVTVLRESLLKQLDNGAFEPRKLKREKVKEVLLSFRRNLQETARSECIKGSVTTFDYV
jgi:putative transposase